MSLDSNGPSRIREFRHLFAGPRRIVANLRVDLTRLRFQPGVNRSKPFMKPSLPRLQILTGLLARPQEPPCQSGRKLAEYLANDIGTADEFLADMAGDCDTPRHAG